MPDNVLLTPKTMARFTLFDLGNRLRVARNMSTAITPEFAKKSFKIGDTVQVRKPYRFVGGDGLDWDPEPLVDQVTPITVSNVPHVHWFWDSVEKTLTVREMMELYAGPAAISMASKINAICATFAGNNALNSVGTPGTAPTSEATYLAAGDRLVELGLPDEEEVTLIVNRRMSTAFVSGVKTLFNPTGTLAKQWMKGKMMDSLGYNVELDQTINVRTNGTFTGTPLVNGANQVADGGNNATMTLITDGWTSTTLNVGDRFTLGSASSATVGGVNSVHPQTRISTGSQQVFTVVNQITDTAGAISVVIQPAITPATLTSPGNQYANVDIAPVDNAIITMIGTTALTNIQQGLLIHKNAFAFCSVPMSNPGEGMGALITTEKDDETGLNIRHVAYFAGDSSTERHKLESLIGVGGMYKEMAVVIQA